MLRNDECIGTVQATREELARRFDLDSTRDPIATTHTHGGPDDRMAENWERPLSHIIGDGRNPWHGFRPSDWAAAPAFSTVIP